MFYNPQLLAKTKNAIRICGKGQTINKIRGEMGLSAMLQHALNTFGCPKKTYFGRMWLRIIHILT
jgi:hypothetical protein